MNDLWNSPFLAQVAREMKSSMRVGEILRHPDGRLVEVLDGAYLGKWTWAPLLEDGTLGPEESGHGW